MQHLLLGIPIMYRAVMQSVSMQVIYASVPIWAAILSLLLLSEQHFGAMGWLGAVVVVTASVAMGMWQ